MYSTGRNRLFFLIDFFDKAGYTLLIPLLPFVDEFYNTLK
jgi:hypothetical protein